MNLFSLHDVLFWSSNLNQVEFGALIEFGALLIWRRLRVRRMLAQGVLKLEVAIAPRLAVLRWLLLITAGLLLHKIVAQLFGPMGWPVDAVLVAQAGTALRTVGFFGYVRTLTVERDGEWVWIAFTLVAFAFAAVAGDWG